MKSLKQSKHFSLLNVVSPIAFYEVLNENNIQKQRNKKKLLLLFILMGVILKDLLFLVEIKK